MTNHAAQPGSHPLADRGADLYETPDVATEALLRVEPLPNRIWEPACGPGAIVRVLRRAGHDVYATDIHDYGCPWQSQQIDFLQTTTPGDEYAVVTNPPFKLASEFVEHALMLCPKVVMLLRLMFLESQRRTPILDSGKLARVHVFKNRLPMMHRAGWDGPKSTSSMPFAWFVWERDHNGPAQLNRIEWKP